MAVEKKRVFIGGLFHGVTEQQVCDRFNKFGQVESVNVRVKTDETGQPVKTFAYVDITASEKRLKQCMQVYNKSKWKGSELQLQWAKESFLERLKKEQTEAKDETNTSVEKSVSEPEEPPVALRAAPKKATPGTLVGEEKTWVIGKYGRVLPIVNIRRKDKKRVILFDPSKCCHQVKKLDTTAADNSTEKAVDSLTWQLEDDNSLMMKLRTGQVAWKNPVKKKPQPPPKETKTDHTPKRRQDSVDDNQFEIVKPRSVYSIHQQDDDEAYSSADTEEMITQMKSSSAKKCRTDNSCSDKVVPEKTLKSSSVKTKACVDVVRRADISAMSPIGACVNGSVEKPQRLSVQGQRNVLKPSRLKTSTPKDVGVKRVYKSDSESDSSLEQVLPKQTRKKSKLTKIVRRDESDSSQDTDDIISDLRHKVGTPSNASTTVCSDRSLYVTADDDDQPLPESQRQSSSDGDDEDAFDLIESGRIEQLYKSAKSSPNVKDASTASQEKRTEPDGVNTSKQTTAAQKASVSKDVRNKKDDANVSSDKIKPKKSKAKKLSEGNATVSPVMAASEEKRKNENKAKKLSEGNATVSPVVAVSVEKRKKEKKAKKLSEGNATVSPLVAASEEKRKKEKKEKSAFTQKFDKRKLSNEQRVSSVNERLKEARSQKLLIKKALSDVDKTSAKKIIFDSSDEEEVVPQSASVSRQGQGEEGSSDGSSSSEEDSDTPITPRQDDNTAKTKGLLFDSDDGSSESEAEDQRMFELRPEFEGKAGSKLMKLQSRFRNDQRFKLDKRFLESGSEGDDEDEPTVHKDDLEEGTDERARSLAILKSVVGEKAVQHMKQRAKRTSTFKDVATLHYDPSREDHKHFELDKPVTKDNDEDSEGDVAEKTSKKKKKKKQKDDEPGKEVSPPPEKLPGKFFEVSGGLKDLLKPAEKKPFSLLSMFGSTQVDDSDVKRNVNEDAVVEVLPVGHVQWQPQFGSDDSDEETDGASLSVREEAAAMEPVTSEGNSQEPKSFFFVDNDPRIASGMKCFCRPAEWETIREKWFEKRPDLVEDYRMKRKRAVRKGHSQSQRGNFGKTQRGGRR